MDRQEWIGSIIGDTVRVSQFVLTDSTALPEHDRYFVKVLLDSTVASPADFDIKRPGAFGQIEPVLDTVEGICYPSYVVYIFDDNTVRWPPIYTLTICN